MREIFFKEKLGETQRNSEGVRAARARMGCEPHGQGWGASRTGRDGSCGVRAARARMGAVGGTRRNSEGLGEVGGTRRGE